MLVQAAGLAFLASLSPTALLVAAVYLGSARPRLTAAFYLAGAIVMSAVLAAAIVVALRASGLNRPDEHAPRYGLRLGLGLVLLAAGIVVAVRKPKAPDPAKARPGVVSRMVANPKPRSAFTVGILLFTPGVTFLAALQVIATARASLGLTVLAVVVVVVINVLLVWLPIVAHLVAPELTGRRLRAFNVWLRANGHALLAGVLVVAGAIMVFDGIHGFVAG